MIDGFVSIAIKVPVPCAGSFLAPRMPQMLVLRGAIGRYGRVVLHQGGNDPVPGRLRQVGPSIGFSNPFPPLSLSCS